ncbi:MAG TPA: ABC transporter permease [Trinickia sp.]|jgi:ribose transport system permease protein|nr:ABC transporter permease [Trinickia sp.]
MNTPDAPRFSLSVPRWFSNRRQFGYDSIALAYRALFIIVLMLALSICTDSFGSAQNLLNVLRQASLTFLLASGLTLVILSGGFDLSIAANLTLSACLAAGALHSGAGLLAAVAVALFCSTSIGLLNGLMVSFLRLPPFLATYGMLWVAQGLAFHYMGGNEIYGFPAAFRALGTGYWAGVPVPVYAMALVLGAGAAMIRWSNFGRELYLIGANGEAARLSGIPVRKRRIAVYAASGLMSGIAALIFLARVNAADSAMGEPLLLPVIAAILVGGTSLAGGKGSLLGTLFGSLILALVVNGMNLLNVSANWQPIVVGCVLLTAVLIDVVGRKT